MFKKSLLDVLGNVRCTSSDPENTMFDLDESIDGLPVWEEQGCHHILVNAPTYKVLYQLI